MSSGSFVLVVDVLPELIEKMHSEVAKIVAETADEITAVYGATAARATGFMASSAYTVTHDKSTYGQNLQGSGPLLPQVGKPANDLTAIAAVGASYAIYPEFGTRYARAQPAFVPAIDKVKPRFEARFEALESRLKAAGVK